MFQPGDLIEALEGYPKIFTKGKIYSVDYMNGEWVHVVAADGGSPSSWHQNRFKLHMSATIAKQPAHGALTGSIVASSTTSSIVPAGTILPVHGHVGKTEVEQYVEEHYKSPEQERKERIWKALQGAAKQ